MASEEVNIVATLFPKPGKLDEVASHMATFTQQVKSNEPDTLVYYAFSVREKNEIVVVEKYKNEAALKTHMGGTHFKAFVGKVTGLMEKPFDLKRGQLLSGSVGVARI